MSLSDPRPSFRWKLGSSPDGIRSLSIRALRRRTERISSSPNGVAEDGLVDEVHELAEQLGVARHRAGPEECLPLPGLDPAPVVLGVGVEAAGERALPPLRAERGVDGQDPLGGGGAVQPAEEPGGCLLGESGIARPRALVDDEDVEVAPVGELLPAEPAHRDDAHRKRGPDGLEGGRQHGVAEGGEVACRRGERDVEEDVGGGDSERLCLHEVAEGGRSPPAGRARRRGSPAPELGRRRRRQLPVVAEAGGEAGLAPDELAELPSRPEKDTQPPRQLGRLPEGGDDDVAAVRRADECPQPEEALIGVRRL